MLIDYTILLNWLYYLIHLLLLIPCWLSIITYIDYTILFTIDSFSISSLRPGQPGQPGQPHCWPAADGTQNHVTLRAADAKVHVFLGWLVVSVGKQLA